MTDGKQAVPRPKRRTMLITGGVMLVFSIYLLVFLVPDLIRAAAGPEGMTLARAADIASEESTYARLEDGRWQCDTIEYIRGMSSSGTRQIVTRYTEVFYTDATKPEQTVVLVSLSGEVDCAELESLVPEGYLTRMSSGDRQALTNEARLARYFAATDFLSFCGYCGEENSFIGVVFGVIFAVGGFVVLMMGFRMPAGT